MHARMRLLDLPHSFVEPGIRERVIGLASHAAVAQHGGDDVQCLQAVGWDGGEQVVKPAGFDADAVQEFLQWLVAERPQLRDASAVEDRGDFLELLLSFRNRAANAVQVRHIRLQISVRDAFLFQSLQIGDEFRLFLIEWRRTEQRQFAPRLPCEFEGEFKGDALAATGDERHIV